MELKIIAISAIRGFKNPAIAIGIAIKL